MARTAREITWSPEMLAKHPKIGSACQEVMQKDGKTYVKFEGEIKKVSKQGTEVADGHEGRRHHHPESEAGSLRVHRRQEDAGQESLHPGDTLTFYVPEDRLVAAVMETPAAPVEEIQIGPPVEQVAMTTTTYDDLPRTASSWPLAGLLGALCIGFALVMRTRRVLRNR